MIDLWVDYWQGLSSIEFLRPKIVASFHANVFLSKMQHNFLL